MNELPSDWKLHGYWAMTEEERERYDALLLNEERWKELPVNERQQYIEVLLAHTLIGYDITLSLLEAPDYQELHEHIQSVLRSFSRRKEKLLQYIEST